MRQLPRARDRRLRLPASGADVAQLVEHFTRNEGVPGSSPGVGFGKFLVIGSFWMMRVGADAKCVPNMSRASGTVFV
jgi:hypothetical protein